MLRKVALLILFVVVVAALYLTLWPVPINPVAWDPPPAPEPIGPYAVNHDLIAHRRLVEGFGKGPEDVAFDTAGFVYTGFEHGPIVRTRLAGGQPELFVDTHGRPLGMVFDAAGNLIVADAIRGLLKVTPERTIETLVTEANGVPLKFADDLDIAPDGTIYFSDASTKFGWGQEGLDILEHGGHGRLVAYNPATQAVRVVLEGLQFANGVTVARDGSFVLVAETGAYRIRRVWLAGPKAGTDEPFVGNLPGFPDNINITGRGTVWMALPLSRVPLADRIGPSPFIRKLLLRLPPQVMQSSLMRYGEVVELGLDGKPLGSLHDPTGVVASVTSIMERGDELFLGSNLEASIAVVRRTRR
jgi:sugar lactone lactonase YvrE